MCEAPLAALARDEEEQNNVEWIPKLNAHAQNVLGATEHYFAPLDPSRGQQEEPHTQFARRMETKVVVATMWLSVGIGLEDNHILHLKKNLSRWVLLGTGNSILKKGKL